jgi:hypothetical protein
MHAHAILRFARHSRENGNPESFQYLDSRLRGSDNLSLRLKQGFAPSPEKALNGGE